MKTAAVIGANSMLGKSLVSELSAMGINVISVGRFAEATIHLDLSKGFLSPLPKNMNVDVIFHCAASFADDSLGGIKQNFQVNTASCLWVLELAEYLNCYSIIYSGSLSSIATLDSNPFSSYGFSKAQGEQLLDWGMKRVGGRFCSLRFPQIYDTAGACIRHQPWFGRIIAYAARGVDLNMPKSEGGRNFLHLDDAVRLMIAAAQTSAVGILDVVHPEILTYQEIASLAYSIFGKGGQVLTAIHKSPFRVINFPQSVQTFQMLGQLPKISMADGITHIRNANTYAMFGPLDVT